MKKGDRVAESTSVQPLVKMSLGKGGLGNLKALQKGNTTENLINIA